MTRNLVNNAGNTEDIRCSLYHINPKSDADKIDTINWLTICLNDERKNRNRSTVIRMIEVKKKQIVKSLNK